MKFSFHEEIRAYRLQMSEIFSEPIPFDTSELAESVADCAGFNWGEIRALLSRTRTSAPVFASQNLFLRVVKAQPRKVSS